MGSVICRCYIENIFLQKRNQSLNTEMLQHLKLKSVETPFPYFLSTVQYKTQGVKQSNIQSEAN